MIKNNHKIKLSDVGDFLAKFTENSDHVYWISSPDFKKIQYISPSYERIWGRSREELYSNPELWITYLHPDDALDYHPIHEMAARVTLLGEAARYSENYRIIRPDGSVRWIMDHGFPFYNKEGICVGVTGIAIDVTTEKLATLDLEIAKKEAEVANIAKTEFIANMSHDIRTPLAGVIGISDILEKLEANPELKQYAHDIHDCGEQLLAMLNSILDVVSADHVSEQDKFIETFNLPQFIQEVIRLEKPTMLLKNLELIVQIDPTIPDYLMNDKTKIHRILLNLFSNAVKFTENGSIILKAQLLDIQNHLAKVRFSVTDTGIGIPNDQQHKVFDRFFRAFPSYKGQYTGHGVGLHIAQSYAKLLDSEIKLVSQEGVGSTFYVDITSPIGSVDTLSPDTQQQTPDLPASSVENRSCLLIEDNLIALKALESIVASAGLKYQSNIDAESALQTAKTQSFDFIITDIGLPKMSGNDFVKNYRQWEKEQNKVPIPIFALTAHAHDETKKESLQAGINAIFAKPFSIQTLNTVLTNYLQTKPPNLNPDSSINPQNGLLGPDLPNTEEALFMLNHFAILDSKKALSFVGNDVNTLKNILSAMANEEIPNETKQLEIAYLSKDWNTIENLVHKMKGGAIYVGAERLKFACQYLERYKKTGYSQLLEKLYQQMMYVIVQTRQEICQYLQQPFDK